MAQKAAKTETEETRAVEAAEKKPVPMVRPPRKKGASLEKKLSIVSLALCALVLLVFLLDLVTGFPFGRVSVTLDIVLLLASGLLAYISWEGMREFA
ncbi:MAG: hypothetical protein C4297_13225 [Gemmataceae bacterium]